MHKRLQKLGKVVESKLKGPDRRCGSRGKIARLLPRYTHASSLPLDARVSPYPITPRSARPVADYGDPQPTRPLEIGRSVRPSALNSAFSNGPSRQQRSGLMSVHQVLSFAFQSAVLEPDLDV